MYDGLYVVGAMKDEKLKRLALKKMKKIFFLFSAPRTNVHIPHKHFTAPPSLCPGVVNSPTSDGRKKLTGITKPLKASMFNWQDT